jgi:amino acid transporter
MGKRWAGVIRFIGIGWYIAACILLGALGGRWVGRKLDGSSFEAIFTFLGLALGLILAFLGVYRMFKAIEGNNQDSGKGKS